MFGFIGGDPAKASHKIKQQQQMTYLHLIAGARSVSQRKGPAFVWIWQAEN